MVLRFPSHKTFLVFAFVLVLVCLPLEIYAQNDKLKPGIYAVVNEGYIPLEYVYGGSSSSEIAFPNLSQICPAVVRYRGTSSCVEATDTFLYVLDPTKKVLYGPFNKGMNPNQMTVLSLTINKEKGQREYIVAGKRLSDLAWMDLEWKRLDDYTFEIHIPGLTPGEYGIVFRRGKLGPFDYTRLHCFSVPNKTL